jgi:hypothetical protein
MAPHLRFHVARLPGGNFIQGRKIERPGHIIGRQSQAGTASSIIAGRVELPRAHVEIM